MKLRSRLRFITLGILLCFFLLLILNAYEFYWMQQEHLKYHHYNSEKPRQESSHVSRKYDLKFSVFGRDVDSGFLRHVFNVFEHFGFSRVPFNGSQWDVLWAHDYPFKKLSDKLKSMKPHQKVNHFPGTGYITNKMDLATSDIKYIPKAFKIPEEKEKLLTYVKANPNKKFVQKSNDHRGIKILNISKMNLNALGSFVQEYIDNPLLVDGHKFDIGVYTAITSIDPLRVYIYNGDVLFRYCPERYHPFDYEKPNKYVIGDDYLPTWEVPSLKKLYIEFGFSMKETFNIYIRQRGHNPDTVWEQIEDAIREICLSKEGTIAQLLTAYASKRNFFEMIRFDFVVDEEFNVFVMEANMSPNLSSAHFPPNRLLYEQVLYNLFSLVGLARMMRHQNDMEVADKNLVVLGKECLKCTDCNPYNCLLCLPCFSSETKQTLKDAYLEHINKGDYKRIFPPGMKNFSTQKINSLSPENQIMVKWFYGKCLEDDHWC